MSAIHCFFCGGKECKYENWRQWTSDPRHPNAIDGLFSNWISPNILAMQRPSTRLMKEYNLIETFKSLGIMSIFNLQENGEHASCGDGNEQASGFSYLPEAWMNAGVSYYNFGWKDMDTPDFESMLSIVQVMSHALEDDKKAPRSIPRYRFIATQDWAIVLVRSNRPLSIQTKKQQSFVHQFSDFLNPLRMVFPGICQKIGPHSHEVLRAASRPVSVSASSSSSSAAIPSPGPGQSPNFSTDRSSTTIKSPESAAPSRIIKTLSLKDILANQQRVLRGNEQRNLKHIPKIAYKIINRIRTLRCIYCQTADAPSSVGEDNRASVEWFSSLVFNSFVQFGGMSELSEKMAFVQARINTDDWEVIDNEDNPGFLVELLLYWLTSLKEPVISNKQVKLLDTPRLDPKSFTKNLSRSKLSSINYLLELVRLLPELSSEQVHRMLDQYSVLLTSARSSICFPFAPKLVCLESFNPPPPSLPAAQGLAESAGSQTPPLKTPALVKIGVMGLNLIQAQLFTTKTTAEEKSHLWTTSSSLERNSSVILSCSTINLSQFLSYCATAFAFVEETKLAISDSFKSAAQPKAVEELAAILDQIKDHECADGPAEQASLDPSRFKADLVLPPTAHIERELTKELPRSPVSPMSPISPTSPKNGYSNAGLAGIDSLPSPTESPMLSPTYRSTEVMQYILALAKAGHLEPDMCLKAQILCEDADAEFLGVYQKMRISDSEQRGRDQFVRDLKDMLLKVKTLA
ncbi:uncharacterized protein BJ171DRAFT_581367 [Polychytrium aggregatum]|uniref:uncharacterized protein n=1 Tax=Polychytrium aggregatum TaxID=110093 RepID=UPI0022FDB5DB|nr:uncharacterized protein BJ171DRAFT_581367 [Polychytrium aggregatum]KAI9205161.1 hypothetical protein BJ171DRAFT_581367 [Polychytrium aggregatum]